MRIHHRMATKEKSQKSQKSQKSRPTRPTRCKIVQKIKVCIAVKHIECYEDGYDSDATVDDDDYVFVSREDVQKSHRIAEILYKYDFKKVTSLSTKNDGLRRMFGFARQSRYDESFLNPLMKDLRKHVHIATFTVSL